ncbi:hypothetical protein Plec18170_001096 [Paecilomyces lecythidis]
MGHQSTPELPSKADIVIIGSGITGASIARFLDTDPRAAGKSVVMLDAREVCWGATGRNGGHCQPLPFDRSPDVAAFEFKNVEAVRSYIEQNDIPCEWRLVTACRLLFDNRAFTAARIAIDKLKKVEVEVGKRIRTLTGSQKADLDRIRVQDGVAGVTMTEGALQLWPYKYVTFIIEKLVKEGRINLQTHTPVTNIEDIGGKNARKLVCTPRGNIAALHVVLATNGYTSHILPDFQSLIVPMRCEMSALHPPEGSERLSNSYGMAGFEGDNPEHLDYLVQRPFYRSADGKRQGGHLMFGGGLSYATYDCIGQTDDDIVDIGEASYLRRALLKMIRLGGNAESLKELKASHQWTGIKGYSRDNMPWVGKVPRWQGSTWSFDREGLWLAGGYSGHGMPNATLCGKAIVEMILSEDTQGSLAYEAVCESLVTSKDLPSSYLITKRRLQAAMNLPTVAQQDKLIGSTNLSLTPSIQDSESKGSKL